MVGQNNDEMRLLALDGGGIRGLSTLYILEDVMMKLKFVDGLDYVPSPYQYFDMICGTSTGGIIAIMLGRLKMSVQECIELYINLGHEVFGEENGYHKKTKYSADALERCIERIVKEKTGDAQSQLLDDSCTKVFVTTYECRAMGGEPVLLRSYTSPNRSKHCTIVEAARATSAAPTFFPPKSIGSQTYIDGGMGRNNPTKEIINECNDLLRLCRSSRRRPSAVLSIGTGSMDLTRLEEAGMLSWWKDRSGLNCARAIKDIVTDCESTHVEVTRQFEDLEMQDIYFRFNVDKGLEKVILDEHRKVGDIESATETYLRKINAMRLPEKCSKLLLLETGERPSAFSRRTLEHNVYPQRLAPQGNVLNYAGHNINQVDLIQGPATFN